MNQNKDNKFLIQPPSPATPPAPKKAILEQHGSIVTLTDGIGEITIDLVKVQMVVWIPIQGLMLAFPSGPAWQGRMSREDYEVIRKLWIQFNQTERGL